MNKRLMVSSLLAAGLLAAGAANAQIYDRSAASTADIPVQAGEASTTTGGAPNMRTTNSPYPDGTVVLTSPIVVTSPSYPYVVSSGTTPAVVAGTTYYSGGPHYPYTYSTHPHYPYGPSTSSTTVMGAAPVYVVPGSTVVMDRPLLGQPAVVQPREITTNSVVITQ